MSIINSILLHVRSVIHRCPIEYIYYKLMPCYVAVAVAVAVTEVEAEDKENWLSVPGFIFSTESSFFYELRALIKSLQLIITQLKYDIIMKLTIMSLIL